MIDPTEIEARPTVAALLHRNARVFGDREFLVSDVDRMTHREAETASWHLARRLLAAGAGKGTRIGAQFPYGSAWITCWLAASRIGALFVPFSTAYKPPEFLKSLRHSDVQILLMPGRMHGEDRQAFLEQAIPGLASQAGSMLYLEAAPCLRSIWILDGAPCSWARPLGLAPYKGSGAARTAFMAGEIDAVFDALSGFQAMIDSGKARPVFFAGLKRTTLAPNLPTAAEVGYPSVRNLYTHNVWLPKGSPQQAVQVLNRAINEAVTQPDVVDLMRRNGSEPISGTPQEMVAHVRQEMAIHTEGAKAANFKPAE